MPAPSDWREILQWFVNTYGLYSGSTRGLFLTEWGEEQSVSLEAAVINLKSRGFQPFVMAGETLFQQAEFLFDESRQKVQFGRPLASKVELELSGNDIVIIDGLGAPSHPSHIWYLLYYILFPRIISGKVCLFTTQLSYAEFLKKGRNCPDFDYGGYPLNWEKLLFLFETTCINQDLFKLAREESVPPMLKPELVLYLSCLERGLEPVPQHVLGDYLLDFALIEGERRLNIECDLLSVLCGHEINTKEVKRDFVLLSDGWQILKFTSSELLNKTSACTDVIEDIWKDGRKRSECGRLLSANSLPQAPELPADDVQKSAIVFGGGPLALVGGSGSGKTSCLAQRVSYLLSQGASPDSVLVLSFSAETARLARQKIESLIEKSNLQRLTVMSFHELGMKLLKENLSLIKRKPPLKIELAPQKVIQKLFAKIRKDYDPVKLEMAGEIDEFYIFAMIAMYKAHLISPGAAREDAAGENEELVARIYQAYEDQLQKTNRIDKNDVERLAVQILLESPELRLKYQSAFEFVLVDEYQELTVAQDMFTRILASPQDNLFIAGDEDETISESNSNACPELLSDFSLRYPNGRTIVMEHNWRCHPSIVEHARLLLAYLERRKIQKDFVSAWGRPENAAIFGPQPCIDEAEEAAWIANQVKALVDAGRSAGDIAVLYRQNRYENMLEEELANCGVRFHASLSDNSLIPDELGDMLAFLKLVMDPDGPRAREAFERVCQLGTKEIDPKLSATIDSFAAANNLSYLKAVEIYAEATADQGCRELEQLVRIIRAMNKDRLPPAESIGYLRRTRRLNDYYKNIKVPPNQVYEPLKKLSRMEEEARKFTSVVEFVQHVEERIGEYDDSADLQAVHVKSIFDVKGYEFPIVFFSGLSQGILPLADSADIEEERRLFYVALTRAREAVYLSYPLKISGKECMVSSFLLEARLAQAEAPVSVAPALRTAPATLAPVVQEEIHLNQAIGGAAAVSESRAGNPEPAHLQHEGQSVQMQKQEPGLPDKGDPYYVQKDRVSNLAPYVETQEENDLSKRLGQLPPSKGFEKPADQDHARTGEKQPAVNPPASQYRSVPEGPPSGFKNQAERSPAQTPQPPQVPQPAQPPQIPQAPQVPQPPQIPQPPQPPQVPRPAQPPQIPQPPQPPGRARTPAAADSAAYGTGAFAFPLVNAEPAQIQSGNPNAAHEYRSEIDTASLQALRTNNAFLQQNLQAQLNQPQETTTGSAPACPSCANPLEANARFCGECGYSLPERVMACKGCGAPLEANAKFCGECGKPCAAVPAQNQADKKSGKEKGGLFVKFLKFLES